jgi:hypothetical protein
MATMAVSLPTLAARPHIAVAQGRSAAPGAVSLRDGRSPRAAPVWAQEVGGVQFRRTRSARLVSCSVAATAKENAPETAQRASAAPFNALITGSTKGQAPQTLFSQNAGFIAPH